VAKNALSNQELAASCFSSCIATKLLVPKNVAVKLSQMYHRHVFHYSVVIRWFGKNRARPVEDLQHCPISKFNYWKTITVSSSFNRREIYTGSLYHTTTIPQYEKSITANSLSTGFLMPEIRTRYTVQNFGHLPGNLRAMLFIRS
jgi:hypothetical protein